MNKAAKEFVHIQFHEWYAKQACSQSQQNANKSPIDLCLSSVKPLGAQWMVELHDYKKGKTRHNSQWI